VAALRFDHPKEIDVEAAGEVVVGLEVDAAGVAAGALGEGEDAGECAGSGGGQLAGEFQAEEGIDCYADAEIAVEGEVVDEVFVVGVVRLASQG
jgi:hypothetical protein